MRTGVACTPQVDVPLAERTTLGVGGPARYWLEAGDVAQIVGAVTWARQHEVALEVLGGGSNALIADAGIDGLVMRVAHEARHVVEDSGDEVVVDVGAGCNWEALVRWSVEQNLAGLECLSGIPGNVGAAPIQNVGAYGQEVGSVIERVQVVSRNDGAVSTLTNAQCEFAYRDSIFKRARRDRDVVVSVRFRLRHGGAPTLAYPELERAVREHDAPVSLQRVRDTVLQLRRRKSMILDPDDENRRSAGSFFVNPVVDDTILSDVLERAQPMLSPSEHVPQYPAPSGTKLAAAWLIERAGFAKGTRKGNVGISSRHSLAIINCGHATAAEIVAFAVHVRERVRDVFGVTLYPEPRPLGFTREQIHALVD